MHLGAPILLPLWLLISPSIGAEISVDKYKAAEDLITQSILDWPSSSAHAQMLYSFFENFKNNPKSFNQYAGKDALENVQFHLLPRLKVQGQEAAQSPQNSAIETLHEAFTGNHPNLSPMLSTIALSIMNEVNRAKDTTVPVLQQVRHFWGEHHTDTANDLYLKLGPNLWDHYPYNNHLNTLRFNDNTLNKTQSLIDAIKTAHFNQAKVDSTSVQLKFLISLVDNLARDTVKLKYRVNYKLIHEIVDSVICLLNSIEPTVEDDSWKLGYYLKGAYDACYYYFYPDQRPLPKITKKYIAIWKDKLQKLHQQLVALDEASMTEAAKVTYQYCRSIVFVILVCVSIAFLFVVVSRRDGAFNLPNWLVVPGFTALKAAILKPFNSGPTLESELESKPNESDKL